MKNNIQNDKKNHYGIFLNNLICKEEGNIHFYEKERNAHTDY